MSSAVDHQVADVLDALAGVLGELGTVGLDPVHIDDAYTLVAELEACGRRLRAAQIALLGRVQQRGLHRADGHASAKVLVRHSANLSDAEATRRAKSAAALRDLPAVAAGLASGEVGACQVDRIARTHANPRVRAELVGIDADLAVIAAQLPYREFDRILTDWERLTDTDGAAQKSERAHANRDFRIHTNLDGTRRFDGGCGSLQGAEIADIFDHYLHTEFEADWAEARHRLGPAATAADLCRTDAQRRMDAATAIFRDAADHHAQQPGNTHIVTNIVLDHTTLQRELARLTGTNPGPDPRTTTWIQHLANQHHPNTPTSAAGADGGGDKARPDSDLIGFRSSTIDGTPIDTREATHAALTHHIRRVILGADNVALDMSRKTRLFTGPRQLAAQLQTTTCYWPGCNTPTSHCQTDHLQPWNNNDAPGRTDQTNAAPLCGKHNRYRNHGHTTHRNPNGTWHITRPDGTTIPNPGTTPTRR